MRSIFIALILLAASPLNGRSIEFSGQWWEIKTGNYGPGNKHWCDGTNAVWVDNNGDLHLRINYDQSINDWCQVEIYSLGFAEHGSHHFQVISQLDQLDEDVVLGMFTYVDIDANDSICPIIDGDHVCEIDIEITNSFFTGPDRGNFIIQPSSGLPGCDTNPPNRNCLFNINMPGGTYSSHRFQWFPSFVNFDSWHGHGSEPTNNTLMNNWAYFSSDGFIPPESVDQRIHINLWVCTEPENPDPKAGPRCKNGDGTLDDPVEVIIRSYTGNIEPFKYDLGVSINGNGYVSADFLNCFNSCTYNVDVGTLVELAGVPDPGYVFAGWSGTNCDSFRLFEDTNCIANFVEDNSAPDLTVLDVNVSNETPAVDEVFEIEVEATNQGSSESSVQFILYYASDDQTI